MATTLADIVAYIRGDNTDLKEKLSDSEKASQSSGANMAKFLGGAVVAGAAVAGAAIIGIGGKAFDVASDIDAATDQIGSSLGLTSDEAARFGNVIKTVYGDNFGDSIEDVGIAVENVAKQLKLTADDPSLPRITENAFRLRDVFGTEVSESVDAVKTLMENFGVTGEEAFDLIATGYQRGLDRSGDFLDTIGEYSVQFSNGGASASDFFKILEEGAQGGMLGTDKAADAFKEFNIRIMDGSKTTNTALKQIGISYEEVSDGFADGSLTSVEAMRDVLDAIFDIEDPISRQMAGVALFGTQWEDLGEDAMKAIAEINEGFGAQEGAIDSLDTKYTSLGGVVEGMWRKFQVGIAPAGEAMLAFVNDNLPVIQGVVNTVSGAVVNFIGMIPLALVGAKTAWDEDWAGMRTTAEDFARDIPILMERMWAELDILFQREGDETGEGWERFWGGMGTFFTGWIRIVLVNWTLGIQSIGALWSTISALFQGDWEGFWDNLGIYVDTILQQILNYVEFIFGAGLRDAFVGAMENAWEGLKGTWAAVSDWWNKGIGGLLGIEAGNVGDINFNQYLAPRNPYENQRMLEEIERQYNNPFGGVNAQMVGASSSTKYEINVNTGGGGYDQGFAAGEGVLDAIRFRGG